MKATLSERGQITIPKKIREDLGLEPGAVLDFVEDGGEIRLRKVLAENPISAWKGRGCLPCGGSVDDYLRNVRG